MGHFQGRGTASLMMVVMMMMTTMMMTKGVVGSIYEVGDGKWTIMSYDSWLSGKTFKVGDTLEFVYSSAHNVVEVDETDYGSCSQGSNTVYTDGDTKYTLSTTGTKYYICSVPTHCESGMKLAVSVEGTVATTPTTSSSPATPSTPSPTTPSTPSTPASTTPSTPSPSSNSSHFSWPSLLFTLLLTLSLSILFFK